VTTDLLWAAWDVAHGPALVVLVLGLDVLRTVHVASLADGEVAARGKSGEQAAHDGDRVLVLLHMPQNAQQHQTDRLFQVQELTRLFQDLLDRKSTRLNSSHVSISYAVFCLKKKTHEQPPDN